MFDDPVDKTSDSMKKIADAVEVIARGQAELAKNATSERRWRGIRMGGMLLLAALSVSALFSASGKAVPESEHIAVVRMKGAIGPGEMLSAENYIPALVQAFDDKSAKAVTLVVNSPGGTPVQASLLHDRLRRLKDDHPDKPLVVVAEDTMASGAYFIAAAADRIVVNRSSVVGSIGVVSQQFGLTDLMEKVGVENRTMTAGSSKVRMSPFAPVKPEDTAKMTVLLGQIHEHFKDVVKAGRKGKLKGTDEELFNGDIWVGDEAVKLGLADELGDLHSVAKSYGVKQFVDYTPQANPISKLTKELGIAAGEGLASTIMAQTTPAVTLK